MARSETSHRFVVHSLHHASGRRKGGGVGTCLMVESIVFQSWCLKWVFLQSVYYIFIIWEKI